MWEIVFTVVRQLFRKPASNPFPVRYAPESISKKVQEKDFRINPPVPLPPAFRGRIAYDKNNCTGCRQCLNVCPAQAIEFLADEKKIKIYVSRCCFCAQCVDVCPVHTLAVSDEFLLANYDKNGADMITTDSGELPGAIKRKVKDTGGDTGSGNAANNAAG